MVAGKRGYHNGDVVQEGVSHLWLISMLEHMSVNCFCTAGASCANFSVPLSIQTACHYSAGHW